MTILNTTLSPPPAEASNHLWKGHTTTFQTGSLFSLLPFY